MKYVEDAFNNAIKCTESLYLGLSDLKCSLIEVETLPFIIVEKLIVPFYQGWVKLCISAVSGLIHQKAPLWCWT